MQRLRLSPALSRTASALTLAVSVVSATSAAAQDGAATSGDSETIIATGVPASLDRSIDLKRNSAAVVDGISAEDIGKFPDTNLAESLQRITGVSIDRFNGEGSRVTG